MTPGGDTLSEVVCRRWVSTSVDSMDGEIRDVVNVTVRIEMVSLSRQDPVICVYY